MILRDPLPGDIPILPTVEDLRKCCSVAVDSEDTPSAEEFDVCDPEFANEAMAWADNVSNGVGTANWEDQFRDPDAVEPF